MQYNCDIFTCQEDKLTLNLCSDGFIVDLTEQNEEYVDCYIKVAGRTYTQKVLVSNNLAEVSWKPSEYLPRGEYWAEITFKDASKNPIEIVSGTDCDTYCGISVLITTTCEDGYKYLNEKCGSAIPTPPTENPTTCSWTIEINDCTWVVKNNAMVTIIYNEKHIEIDEAPLKSGMVNDDFLDQLDLIENDAFSVTVVDGDAEINYTGFANVDILQGCNLLTKTCL